MKYKIRELRERIGMSQSELAERSGISRATIWKLETHMDEVTTTQTLVRIASALNVSVNDLFFADNV